jgi:hypothetical protein
MISRLPAGLNERSSRLSGRSQVVTSLYRLQGRQQLLESDIRVHYF